LLGFILLLSAYGYQVLRFSFAIKRLFAMQRFYVHLLEVPDVSVSIQDWKDCSTTLSDFSPDPSSLLRPMSNPFLGTSSSQSYQT